ncbi:YkvA family protein [Hutsoniella sourekii]|uniref:YkvA family protein n=1 Tax=Hutsoniella sourekii TaxID=87650 RepID=UPI0004863132|nr:YkvA family protein [Hutsoniella sourekii]
MNLHRKTNLIELLRSFFSKETPNYIKLLMLGGVAYLVSPVDFLPDVFGLLGFADDAAVVTAVFSLAMHLLDNHKKQVTKSRETYVTNLKEAKPL